MLTGEEGWTVTIPGEEKIKEWEMRIDLKQRSSVREDKEV